MTWAELQAAPAFGFTMVGLVILFGPLLAERIRLPGLVGLLLLDAAVGPNALGMFLEFPRFVRSATSGCCT